MRTFTFQKKRYENYQKYFIDVFGGTLLDDCLIKVDNDFGKGEVFIYENKEMRFVVLNLKIKKNYSVFIEHDQKYDYSLRCFPVPYIYEHEKEKKTIEIKCPLGFILVKKNDTLKAEVCEEQKVTSVAIYCDKKSFSEQMNLSFSRVKNYSVNVGGSKFIRWKEIFFTHTSSSFQQGLYTPWAKCKMNELFILIQNNIIENSDKDDSNAFYDYEFDVALQIKNKIDSDVYYKPVISDLSKEYGLNPVKLSNVFKYTYGKTIYQYYKRNRMTVAREMIMNSDQTLSQIAYELGYTDINHLSKEFRKTYDVSPSDLRK